MKFVTASNIDYRDKFSQLHKRNRFWWCDAKYYYIMIFLKACFWCFVSTDHWQFLDSKTQFCATVHWLEMTTTFIANGKGLGQITQWSISTNFYFYFTGQLRYCFKFSKQAQEWVTKPIYAGSTQTFRKSLMESVLQMRDNPNITYTVPLKTKTPHRRRLLQNIAPVPRPDKNVLVARRSSRFGTVRATPY